MSIKCCHNERCKEYEYLTREETIELVAKRVLTMAFQTWPGVMFITRDNCWVETVSPGCFVADGAWSWGIMSKLYYYGIEKVVGEETRRIINLAKSVEQFDGANAKVLKLIFKRGMMRVKRSWVETDILYAGDMHWYREYCFEPNLTSEDIVAYVALTSNGKPIPIATEEFKEHVW